MALRRWWLSAAVVVLAGLPARADVTLPYGRFLELYKDAELLREPVWSEVQARPELYRSRALCYQMLVKGRIDSERGTVLFGSTRRAESLQVNAPGGCSAGVPGTWLGVIGTIPDGVTPTQLIASAATQVADPAPLRSTSVTLNGAAVASQPFDDGNGVSPLRGTPPAEAPQTVTAAPAEPLRPLPAQELAQRPQPAAPPAPDPNAAEAVAVARLERFISGRNRGVGAGERRLIATEIIRWARYHGMRWEFFAALIAAESNFNRRAVSSAGALGLGQLMPFNCSAYGLSDPFDIKQNLYGAGMHIRGILDKYRSRSASDQFQLTLATYNAGAGAVAKHGGVPPYNETINYIRKVADLYLRLCNAG